MIKQEFLIMTDLSTQLEQDPMLSSGTRNWLILIPAMILPFLGAFIYFFALAGTPFAIAFYSFVKLFTLVYPAIVYLAIEHRRPKLRPIDWKRHLRSIPLGIITGLVIGHFMLLLFNETQLGDMVLASSDAIRQRVADFGVLPYYIPFAVFLSFAHSLLEEYYWRWFVFGRSSALTKGMTPHILAAVAFSLHHYVVLAGFFPLAFALSIGSLVGVGGAIWSWQYQRSGSLAGAWVSHMIVDIVIMTVGYFLVF